MNKIFLKPELKQIIPRSENKFLTKVALSNPIHKFIHGRITGVILELWIKRKVRTISFPRTSIRHI